VKITDSKLRKFGLSNKMKFYYNAELNTWLFLKAVLIKTKE